MAKFAKSARRAIRRATSASKTALVDRSPDWIRKPFGPFAAFLDMVVFDHGFFRLVYLNLHNVKGGAWRAAQPAPHHFARFHRLGIKTIINLRGDLGGSTDWLEERACARYGIELVKFRLRSRAAPTVEEVLGARDVFQRIDYPVVMHCKSGADRAGLMSALYLHFQEGLPIAEAQRALSVRYGHIRQADTGILDRFFEAYLADTRTTPKDFVDWLQEDYDPDLLMRTFQAEGWANRLVNTVLRRE